MSKQPLGWEHGLPQINHKESEMPAITEATDRDEEETMSGLNQEPELTIDPKAVINGFCWAYTRALRDGLEKIMIHKGHEGFFPYPGSPNLIGELAGGLVRRLQNQLGEDPNSCRILADVQDLIERANFNLDLFRKK